VLDDAGTEYARTYTPIAASVGEPLQARLAGSEIERLISRCGLKVVTIPHVQTSSSGTSRPCRWLRPYTFETLVARGSPERAQARPATSPPGPRVAASCPFYFMLAQSEGFEGPGGVPGRGACRRRRCWCARPFQDADGQVAQGGHGLGSAAGADLGGVFAVADVAEVVQGLDLPVAADPGGGLGRGCLVGVQAGDRVDGDGPPPPAVQRRIWRVRQRAGGGEPSARYFVAISVAKTPVDNRLTPAEHALFRSTRAAKSRTSPA